MTGKFYALDFEYNANIENSVVAVLECPYKSDLLAKDLSRLHCCLSVAVYCLDVVDNVTISSKLVKQYFAKDSSVIQLSLF